MYAYICVSVCVYFCVYRATRDKYQNLHDNIVIPKSEQSDSLDIKVNKIIYSKSISNYKILKIRLLLK